MKKVCSILFSAFIIVLLLTATPINKAFAEGECSINIYPEPTSGTHTYTVTYINNSGLIGKSMVHNFYDSGTLMNSVSGDSLTLDDSDVNWSLSTIGGYGVYGNSTTGVLDGQSINYHVTLTLQSGVSGIDTNLATEENNEGTTICTGHMDDSSFTYDNLSGTPTPTPAIILAASPSTGTKTVGAPFTVNVTAESNGEAFNAARATVAKSSNLTINSISAPSSNSCNMHYTTTPTVSSPSFAGAIYASSSTSCTVYTMVVTPNAPGTGTITFTNGSIKSYEDNSEILTGVTNASFTLGDGPTPTPTATLEFAITNLLETYNSSFNLTGTKLDTITSIFVNGSDEDSTYPTATSWTVPVTLDLGDNNFTLYGSDGTNQTATQTVTVNRHTLGDINGDGEIDLIDASLFAVDWDKTEDLTYILSDMNDDGNVDLTDLSILAKLQD